MSDLFLNVILSGLLLALLLTPIGCFLMWQRMSFLADTLSHSAILGTAIGLYFNFFPVLANFIYLILFVILLKWLLQKHYFTRDSVFSLLSYGGMSLGLVLIFLHHDQTNIHKILFGDLLSIESSEIALLTVLTILINLFLWFNHKKLVFYTLDKDLAKTAGIKTELLENIFLISTAIAVAFSMQCVGALIVPALLIIPACAVRSFSTNYLKMIFSATLFAIIMMPIGLLFVKTYDSPIGPTIIITYLGGLLFIQGIKKFIKN